MSGVLGITLAGVGLGAAAGLLLSGGLPEGAFSGLLLGASLGLIIAMRRAQGGTGMAFEYEAAGIHDDNLVTTMRRRLIREADRQSALAEHSDSEIGRLAECASRTESSGI